MPRRVLKFLLIACCSLAGCATQTAKIEPVINRPVVVVESAESELVGVLEMLRTGKLQQAEVHLEEIIKARPDIPEAHFNLGWTRHQLNKHGEAITHFEEGLKLRPNDVHALNLLGVSQRETGRFADAEASYLKAIALAPDFVKAQLNLGILYELYLKKRPTALKHYRNYRALSTAPDPKVDGWITLIERQGINQ